MKYTRPIITVEKFALGNPILPDTTSLIDENPVIEGNDPTLETSSSLGDAFNDVFDFSQR